MNWNCHLTTPCPTNGTLFKIRYHGELLKGNYKCDGNGVFVWIESENSWERFFSLTFISSNPSFEGSFYWATEEVPLDVFKFDNALKAAKWLRDEMFVRVTREILDDEDTWRLGQWRVTINDYTIQNCNDDLLVEIARDLGWKD